MWLLLGIANPVDCGMERQNLSLIKGVHVMKLIEY